MFPELWQRGERQLFKSLAYYSVDGVYEAEKTPTDPHTGNVLLDQDVRCVWGKSPPYPLAPTPNEGLLLRLNLQL